LSIIDATKSKMAISILIKSFLFKKALMQEHFNENYLESDKFPKATFKGDILNFNNVSSLDATYDVKGMITIHGVSKEIVVPTIFKRNDDTIFVKGEFNLLLEDFDIKIPRLLLKKIAKEINVTFEFNHKPYNR
jgi:polyisoprenoid-binding protein YceI